MKHRFKSTYWLVGLLALLPACSGGNGTAAITSGITPSKSGASYWVNMSQKTKVVEKGEAVKVAFLYYGPKEAQAPDVTVACGEQVVTQPLTALEDTLVVVPPPEAGWISAPGSEVSDSRITCTTSITSYFPPETNFQLNISPSFKVKVY